ncbi:interaptin-like isoform X2 [Neoarius graeffei]|uniref:interaptin-like isoform X2 n=1 Tax=Neoarius graeffei TaxID=443677 RepID=UPI00298C09D2|nr:interaptin-like isoform X2 [Neoarius graeffei]
MWTVPFPYKVEEQTVPSAMFLLICPYNRVFAYPGDDITVSSHLSPETSAVSMEVRWFRGTECIYQYKNGQVSVGKGYEGRASLFIPELKRGNVSLILKSIAPMDTGTYSCQVLTGQHKVEKSIHLYMSGMEPLSPDIRPKLTEKDRLDMDESVLILELKKLLQQKEKELQDKTRELESTTETLRKKASLLLYMDTDLENMSKLANQKEEQFKNVVSELETCKRQVETLGQKLQEKDAQVKELRVILQDKEQERTSEEQQITEGLKNTAQGTAHTEDSVRLLELTTVLQNKEKEFEEKTEQLESTTGELTRMMQLLQDRDAEMENLRKERDEALTNMTAEMEMCFQELLTLGQKLQEKNAQVEKLQELANSDDLLCKMSQNPKEQLEELESWIYKKREERRLREEEETTHALENEFLDYVSAVKELIGKKHETIVAWATMMAVLQNKLEVVETDEEREALEIQLKEALEMQRQGEEQIESLSEDIEEKRSGIEERHKQEIEEIREKYSTVSRIEAETNILKIILPDVQAYFQNLAANATDARRRIVSKKIAAERRSPARMEMIVEEEILENQTLEPEVEVMTSMTSSLEINNNCAELLVHEANGFMSEETRAEEESNKTVNDMNGEQEQEVDVKDVNEHAETDEEDVVSTQ